MHRRGRLRHRPGAAQHVGKGELRRGDGVARWRVHDDDPSFGGRLDVDVVDAHARPPDHLKLGRRGNDFSRDLGLAAHGDGLHVPDQLPELLHGGTVGLNHLEVRLAAQELQYLW